MSPTTTIIVLGSLGAVLVAVDVYLALDGVKGNTWSEGIWKITKRSRAITFAAGVVVGHLFWPGG